MTGAADTLDGSLKLHMHFLAQVYNLQKCVFIHKTYVTMHLARSTKYLPMRNYMDANYPSDLLLHKIKMSSKFCAFRR